ncbi:hypothetical protein RAA17_13955 [Komagataeibacter rhaeticus]|nr:hypothetical protein [Komagataeibacter rhaeticus]
MADMLHFRQAGQHLYELPACAGRRRFPVRPLSLPVLGRISIWAPQGVRTTPTQLENLTASTTCQRPSTIMRCWKGVPTHGSDLVSCCRGRARPPARPSCFSHSNTIVA